MTNVVQFSQLLLLSGHTVGTDQSPRQRPAGGLVRATVDARSRRRSDAPGDHQKSRGSKDLIGAKAAPHRRPNWLWSRRSGGLFVFDFKAEIA